MLLIPTANFPAARMKTEHRGRFFFYFLSFQSLFTSIGVSVTPVLPEYRFLKHVHCDSIATTYTQTVQISAPKLATMSSSKFS